MNEHIYSSISIHPSAIEDDLSSVHCYEVWATWEEDGGNIGVFDLDGIIGWLYPVEDKETTWVWMNEAGHPTKVFMEGTILMSWLKTLAPSVIWATEART